MGEDLGLDASIVIPTFRRNDRLVAALKSCFEQEGFSELQTEILVVDNDPAGRARACVESLRASAPVSLNYVHAPSGGISGARNAGVVHSRGRAICFLDDDETAEPGWLRALIATQRSTGADVVFGPVIAEPETPDPARAAFCREFFSRSPNIPSGQAVGFFGTGNSLIQRATCVWDETPFDAKLGKFGSEDSVFFRELQRRGRRFVWCAEAQVRESVPEARCSVSFLLRRSFKRGQSPSLLCVWRQPPDVLGVGAWMVVGSGQAVVYGLSALCLTAIRSERALQLGGRAVEGLGKVFWMRPFRQPWGG